MRYINNRANFTISEIMEEFNISRSTAIPALSGWLIRYYSWHTIFLINIPIGLIALVMVFLFLPIKDYIFV